MSPSTYLSWKVLKDLEFLFDEALEIRGTIKGTGRKRAQRRQKLGWKKSDTT
jgi:hypothetical protein